MSEIWFISDTHFGHKNILQYEKEARPFNSLEEMHEQLINNWNSVVSPKDIVYHLGDFAFGKQWVSIAERLQGKKRLVLGNHDTYPSSVYLQYFDKLYGMVFWKRCILSHMPVHPNGLGSRWVLNVHGHLHSKQVELSILDSKFWQITDHIDLNYFNVSCEQNNLTPINADRIRERLKEID